jgi:hypothetical protein
MARKCEICGDNIDAKSGAKIVDDGTGEMKLACLKCYMNNDAPARKKIAARTQPLQPKREERREQTLQEKLRRPTGDSIVKESRPQYNEEELECIKDINVAGLKAQLDEVMTLYILKAQEYLLTQDESKHELMLNLSKSSAAKRESLEKLGVTIEADGSLKSLDETEEEPDKGDEK